MSRSTLIKNRHALIPGGAHTYSKGDDQFSANAPKVIVRGKGAYVWDDQGRRYLDWCMGLRSVMLGHRNPAVDRAVMAQVKEGTNFGRPHPIEYELADLLIRTLPGIDMVKFAKNGSTVTTAAVKLARAFTGRDIVAICADHPFFSYDDWFIGTTVANNGVPTATQKLSVTFRYNDLASLEALFKKHSKKIACIIMEAATTVMPKPGFLKGVQRLCRAHGALFILDEMITGFRWGIGGARTHFGLNPDLVTYGKGLGNGYSTAVLAGRREVMELGDITGGKPRVFLVSTTHGAETIALAASVAAITYMKQHDVGKHLWRMGQRLQKGVERVAARHGLEDCVQPIGFAPNLAVDVRDAAGASSLPLKTLLLQEVTDRGLLFQGYFAISFAHGIKEVNATIRAFDGALAVLRRVIRGGEPIERYLKGPVVKPVFRKFN